jgi:hypothetical protein
MLMYFKLVLLISIFQIATCDLEAAVVLFRHGARGPLTESLDFNKAWTGKFGELTEVGAR